MKLYADVNFEGRAMRELRRRGVDVLLAKEDGQGRRRVSIGRLVEDLLLVAEASVEDEWQSRVEYLPL